MALIKQFLRDKRAATSIEYAIIGALISIAIIAGARAVGLAIQTKFYGPIATNLS
jgi:pilus assembly protein Flp/PilA